MMTWKSEVAVRCENCGWKSDYHDKESDAYLSFNGVNCPDCNRGPLRTVSRSVNVA